jgi:ribosomal protein S18 acetylase RimI-like enzyme
LPDIVESFHRRRRAYFGGTRSGVEAMDATVERLDATSLTDGDVSALNMLLLQLSQSDPSLLREDLIKILANPNTIVFVARSSGELVGTLTLVLQKTITGDRARIEEVVTSDAVRRQGVGRLLIRTAVDTAKQLGLRSIDLTSRPSREIANNLYLSEGFKLRETNVFRIVLED